MDTLMSLLDWLPDPARAPFVPSLVARWTVLLALAWAAHAALAGRNPRWRVVLWRALAIGAVTVPILGWAPPVVRWQLPGTDRPESSGRVVATRAFAGGTDPEIGIPEGPAHGQAGRGLGRGPEAPSGIAASGATPGRTNGRPGAGPATRADRSFQSSWSRFGPWVLGVWAAGVVILAIQYRRQVRRLRGIIGRSEPVPEDRIAAWGAPVATPAVEVRTSAEVATPCLARAWRPVLLLPDRLGIGHDRSEIRAILAHELAHARGHDLTWNDILHTVSILLWFHPLVWRVRQAHASACDAVCDAVAADQIDDVASYSQALARLALRAAGRPLAGGLAMARVADVRRRIEALNRRVFRAPIPRRLAVPATLAFGLVVVLIGGLGFTRAGEVATPARQDPPAPDGRTAAEPAKTRPTPPAAVGPRGNAEPSARLSASGMVVDPGGKPVAGATVILREWAVQRTRGMSPRDNEKLLRGEEIPDILAESKTDADGRFRFQDVPAPAFPSFMEVGRRVFPWDLVALAPGHGLTWVQLTSHHQRHPITLTLGAEATIRGRVIEPGGQPVEGAKVKVSGIDPLGRPDPDGLGTIGRLNLLWSAVPLGARTDADGRFTIPGLPRDRVISLIVNEPGHERLVAFAATTDAPQPDAVSRAVRYSQDKETRLPVHTGAFTLTARRADHVLTGRVVFEADGKPAAVATVLHGSRIVKAGEDGRYRLEGLTSGPLELHAIANDSDAAPVDLTIDVPEEAKQIERDLVLPRGLVVAGRVVDETTGHGVENATVRFGPKPEDGRRPTIFGFSKATDKDGRFRLAVPPGRGSLTLYATPPVYPPPRHQPTGEVTNPRFTRDVEGRGGQTVEVADFRLKRAPSIVLRTVDPDGRPVANAQVVIRDLSRRRRDDPGRTDAQGRFEVTALQPGRVTVVDIAADDPPLGATAEVDPEPGRGAPKTLDVRLQPLVTLTGRVLDEDGRPIVGPVIHLLRHVTYRDGEEPSFGLFVDTRNEVAADGTYTFDRLIPGATYSTRVEAHGHASAFSDQVQVKAGQPVRIDDFRLPVVDREVSGVVVDPRGKPLGGVPVGFDRPEQMRSLLPSTGSAWFQETDARGRFHLNSLPRGPIRLKVFRRPEGADRALQDLKSVDIPPGQAEVRIELPDPNDRPRGID